MSNKNNHIQDYATPTEASKDKQEWTELGNTPCSTRQDEDNNGSHVHYYLLEDDNKTIIPDENGKTDIVQKVYWPDDNN